MPPYDRAVRVPIAVTALLIAACASTPTKPNAIPSSRATLLQLTEQQYPGLNVAVAVNGRIVWSEGAGWADIASQKRATPSTQFRTYSSTKWLTAALALRMADKGFVDLDAPIYRYLPSLPATVAPVTLRQLLQHRGGIRHYREGEWLTVSQAHCTRATEALRDFINDPLVASPGEKFNYSSFGFVLASAVLEAAGRRPFHDLLRDEVLAPSGMRSTGPNPDRSREASTYQRVNGSFAAAPASDSSCKFGAGGLYGNAEDLARFGVALTRGKLLKDSSLAAMMTGLPTAPGRADYGLGVTLERDDALGPIASHSGGALGGRSFLLIAPEKGIVVAFAGNFEGPNLRDAAIEIARHFL